MSKKIIVRTEDNEVWKEFQGVTDCAEFFKKTKAVIYNRCATPNRFFLEFGVNLRFESASIKVKVGEKVDGRLMGSSIDEAKLRATETEDETRRRLGLNPYGDWRNDEWLFAMFDRVNKQLYPDGYDAHTAWLSMRGKERIQKGKVRVASEIIEEGYKDIDEEFLDYIK